MLVILLIAVVICCIILWWAEILAALFGLWFLTANLHAVMWIKDHPWQTVLYVAGYFLAGAVWSIVKWWFRETNNVRRAKEDFSGRRDKSVTWGQYVLVRRSNPSDFKSEIIWWIAAWPLSAIWTLINDPVRRACRRIYQELHGVYQRITDHVWAE